jgi:hypothetical protein
MDHTVLLILACITLVASVQGAAAMQTFDCYPGAVQNISPDTMGGLQTVYVFNGSLIKLDGSPWRDAVTGTVPPVGYPGMSTGNVTRGSHLLSISLQGYEDFEAKVSICEHGITQVNVRQVSLASTTAQPGATPPVSPSAAAGTVPVPAPTKAPGFAGIIALSSIAALCFLRKDSF